MTVEAVALWAQRKGLDLLGTGDALQEDWLNEIERAMEEAEPGLLRLRPEVESRVARTLPAGLRRSLRYVVSTEVCCAPPGTPELGGIHHLLYFPSADHARRFSRLMQRHGDLREGRPTLALSSRQLLTALLTFGEDCQMAPAHVFNPWYSSLGTVSGVNSLNALFGDLTPRLLAVETGLTSTPPMCRRVSSLDQHALFSCSDAHSLENLGRECTLVDIEPSFETLMDALHAGKIDGTIKFPVHRARYYLNRCGPCQKSFDERRCPDCGRPLVAGARDRLDVVADRRQGKMPIGSPAFLELLPLAQVIAEVMGASPGSKPVLAWRERLVEALGHERHILTEADEAEIAAVATTRLARAVVAQRNAIPGPAAEKTGPRGDKIEQLGLNF